MDENWDTRGYEELPRCINCGNPACSSHSICKGGAPERAVHEMDSLETSEADAVDPPRPLAVASAAIAPVLASGPFRKKPVVIAAYQLPPAGKDVPDSFHEWCEAQGFTDWASGRDETLIITTLEGAMTAQPGDWIIKGVNGEFYPCKHDIFAATYEPAAALAAPGERAPDLIARGMSWDDTEKLMREACAQAGMQWDDDKQPQDIAVNVMQRLANAAHKAGFKLALERVAASPALQAAAQPAAAEPSPALQAEPVPDINGKPATAHSLLAALVDIYDDGQNAPPEHRCYDENAWREVLTAARNFLATMAAEPVAPAKTRLTIHDYLTKKYKGWPSTMLATEARVFGISYPLSPGWLERHGDTEITEAMAEALRERLGQRGGKSAEAGIAALAHKGKGPQPFGSGPSGISSQAKRSDGVGDVKSTGPAPAPQPEPVEGVETALHAAPTDAEITQALFAAGVVQHTQAIIGAFRALAAPGKPRAALTDPEIQALWNEACNDSPSSPGWNRHIRFARAVLAAHKGEPKP